MCVDKSSAKSKAKGAKSWPTFISNIINKFLGILTNEFLKHLPPSNVDHKSEVVPRSTPPSKSPYQLRFFKKEFKVQINNLMEWGYIRLNKSFYGLPVLFMDKKGRNCACAWL